MGGRQHHSISARDQPFRYSKANTADAPVTISTLDGFEGDICFAVCAKASVVIIHGSPRRMSINSLSNMETSLADSWAGRTPATVPATPKFCIIGAGAIGGMIAALLSRAGAMVNVVARGPTTSARVGILVVLRVSQLWSEIVLHTAQTT
jgi:Ketopantoate reductase PanE/ApbA